jgi:hypothetical protein
MFRVEEQAKQEINVKQRLILAFAGFFLGLFFHPDDVSNM